LIDLVLTVVCGFVGRWCYCCMSLVWELLFTRPI